MGHANPEKRRWGRWLAALATAAMATAATLAFAFPAVAAVTCPQCFGFERIDGALYVERGATAQTRSNVSDLVARARERVDAFYDGGQGHALILVCTTEDCYRRLNGGASHGMAILTYGLVLSPRGTDVTIAVHELSHIELHKRVGAWRAYRGAVPQWFDEGLAVIVSDDRRYLAPEGTADRCRVHSDEALPSTQRAWVAIGSDRFYAAAACRVDDWMVAKGGAPAVLRLAQRIASGGTFGDAYQ